jgi:hypothetical protein
MSLSAGEIVRLLKSDRDALRELAVAVASEPELRLDVINAVLADVATKQDINQLRQEKMAGIILLTNYTETARRYRLQKEILRRCVYMMFFSLSTASFFSFEAGLQFWRRMSHLKSISLGAYGIKITLTRISAAT